jgi:hypothetical protein
LAEFIGQKMITERVQYEIGQLVQMYLWECIDRLKEQMTMDYLQIFDLKILPSGIQVVTHSMEQPFYRQAHYLVDMPIQSLIQKKIFVIDEEQYVTMMLAEEY